MNMNIPEFGTLQMARSSDIHFGNGRVEPVSSKINGVSSVENLKNGLNVGASQSDSSVSHANGKSFGDYLMEAMDAVNTQQMDVTRLQEKVITSPDEVDIHDVTIAMSKARMSLNLAQSVIDRMITGWNEITTTR